MADTNTAVANINPVELMARLEPEQQMQFLQIQHNKSLLTLKEGKQH